MLLYALFNNAYRYNYAVEVAIGNPRPKMIRDYLSCVCLALAPPQMEANTTSQVCIHDTCSWPKVKRACMWCKHITSLVDGYCTNPVNGKEATLCSLECNIRWHCAQKHLLIGISVLPAKNPPPSPQRQQLTHAGSSAAGSIGSTNAHSF
ncbi:hypothetical protein Pelo_13966 [Pelomyxa schiedti]|nr:hypothetical protein Pelo_13966 [Pelomyxa schiedti]